MCGGMWMCLSSLIGLLFMWDFWHIMMLRIIFSVFSSELSERQRAILKELIKEKNQH